MSIDERERRTQRRTDTAGRRSPEPAKGTAGGARGARHYSTQGATALKLDAAQPLKVSEPEPKPALQVAPPAPISVPRAPFVAAVLFLVIAGVFGILLINTKTNENSFQISQLEEQKAALNTEQQELQRQLDTFEAPGSLHAAARKQGLVRGQPALVRVQDSKVTNSLVPGQGSTSITAQSAGAQSDVGAVPGVGK